MKSVFWHCIGVNGIDSCYLYTVLHLYINQHYFEVHMDTV